LLSLNLRSQTHTALAINHIGDTLHSLQINTAIALESSHAQLIEAKPLLEVNHQNQAASLPRRLDHFQTASEQSLIQHEYNSTTISKDGILGSCTFQPYTHYYCRHDSAQLSIQTFTILGGLLGWLNVQRITQQAHCYDHSSKSAKRTLPSISISYHSPWWIGVLACTLRLQATPSPSVSLSFQTFLPPDAHVFLYIRTGQTDRLKSLFIEQRACVADIMGPYGLSTIEVATLYGQTEVYRFLHSAGGSRMSPVTSKFKTTGSQVSTFWANYSSLDCSVSAATVIHDHLYGTAPEFTANCLSNVAFRPCSERGSFTRLHQCILGLTTESLETLLADPQLDVNEIDSLGRTALHMATYLRDIRAVNLLLRHNTNYEMEDYAGKSPLRVAATMGWVEGTAVLANISSDLEQRGDFGCSILHDVCFQGHAHIVKLLLDAGANMEATNDLLETPLRHAVVGNQVGVLKVLHERGAAFTMRDNIGCTAFHDAILVNSHGCLKFLLGLHVRVDQKYLTQGQTALHLLAENADLVTLKIFLNDASTGLAGLDISARDSKSLTALDYLNMRKDDEFKDVFHLLLTRIQKKKSSLSEEYPIELEHNGSIVDEDENDDFADALENQADC